VTAPAHRLQTLPAYPLATLAQRVRTMTLSGIDVINLDVGSPDLPPPDAVIETLAASARQPNKHGYAGYTGIPEFRRAIAGYYQRRFGVTVDSETEVLPLLGSKEGIVNLSLAYLDRGDIALIPDISYPAYALGAYLAGAEVYWLPMPESNGFFPVLDALPADVLHRAKLLWVNYPSNPTGAAADTAFYAQMADFCAQHNILLASDNPYVDVTYDGYVAGSAAQAPAALQHGVEFISFSKSHNMAGWRLGAAVGHVTAIKTLLQVKSNMDSGHFRPIYEAGITALETTPPQWIAARNAVYQRRRDQIMEALPQLGLSAIAPKGALYVWARVQPVGAIQSGDDYAEAALTAAHVSLAPGSIYGPGGQPYIRISLSVTDARLAEALHRLTQWWERV